MSARDLARAPRAGRGARRRGASAARAPWSRPPSRQRARRARAAARAAAPGARRCSPRWRWRWPSWRSSSRSRRRARRSRAGSSGRSASRRLEPQRGALGPLPGGGRLLVTGAGGAWIVGPRRRRAAARAPTRGATWSPRGLFIGAWRGAALSAVAPDGRVAWTLARRRAPSATCAGRRTATASPTGAARAWPSSPATAAARASLDATARAGPRRPGARTAPHTLAWVRARRATSSCATPTAAGRLALAAAPMAPRGELLWSADGRRLLSLGRGAVRVLDVRAGRQWRVASPGGRVGAAAWAPRGRRLALVVRDRRGMSSVVVDLDARRRRAAGGSSSRRAAWTPSPGRRTPAGCSCARRGPTSGCSARRRPRPRRPRSTPVARHFGGTPRVAGWCC